MILIIANVSSLGLWTAPLLCQAPCMGWEAFLLSLSSLIPSTDSRWDSALDFAWVSVKCSHCFRFLLFLTSLYVSDHCLVGRSSAVQGPGSNPRPSVSPLWQGCLTHWMKNTPKHYIPTTVLEREDGVSQCLNNSHFCLIQPQNWWPKAFFFVWVGFSKARWAFVCPSWRSGVFLDWCSWRPALCSNVYL